MASAHMDMPYRSKTFKLNWHYLSGLTWFGCLILLLLFSLSQFVSPACNHFISICYQTPHVSSVLLVLSALFFGFIDLCDLLGVITQPWWSVSPQCRKYTKVLVNFWCMSLLQVYFLRFLSSQHLYRSKKLYFRQNLQQNTKLVYMVIDY